jgi:hypothetical protein
MKYRYDAGIRETHVGYQPIKYTDFITGMWYSSNCGVADVGQIFYIGELSYLTCLTLIRLSILFFYVCFPLPFLLI